MEVVFLIYYLLRSCVIGIQVSDGYLPPCGEFLLDLAECEHAERSGTLFSKNCFISDSRVGSCLEACKQTSDAALCRISCGCIPRSEPTPPPTVIQKLFSTYLKETPSSKNTTSPEARSATNTELSQCRDFEVDLETCKVIEKDSPLFYVNCFHYGDTVGSCQEACKRKTNVVQCWHFCGCNPQTDVRPSSHLTALTSNSTWVKIFLSGTYVRNATNTELPQCRDFKLDLQACKDLAADSSIFAEHCFSDGDTVGSCQVACKRKSTSLQCIHLCGCIPRSEVLGQSTAHSSKQASASSASGYDPVTKTPYHEVSTIVNVIKSKPPARINSSLSFWDVLPLIACVGFFCILLLWLGLQS